MTSSSALSCFRVTMGELSRATPALESTAAKKGAEYESWKTEKNTKRTEREQKESKKRTESGKTERRRRNENAVGISKKTNKRKKKKRKIQWQLSLRCSKRSTYYVYLF